MTVSQTPTEPSTLSARAEHRAIIVEAQYVWNLPKRVWELLERLESLAHGRYTVADILKDVEEKRYQLWLVMFGNDIRAVVVTSIVEHSHASVLVIHHAAGDGMHLWKHLEAEVAEFGKLNGCSQIEIQGRPGWGRVFSDYRESHRVFVRDL